MPTVYLLVNLLMKDSFKVGYTVAGAFIFQAIEGGVEPKFSMGSVRNETVERLWELLYVDNILNEMSWKNSVTTELEQFTLVVRDAVRDGYEGSDDPDYKQKWAFPGAFLYSLTVITTIGEFGYS